MPSTPVHHLLVLLPLPSRSAEEAMEAITRLEDEGALDVVDLARIVAHSDGTVDVVEVARSGWPPLGTDGWQCLLGAILGGPVPSGGDRSLPVISSSFVAELHAVLPTTSQWLAMVATRLDAGAAVAHLASFPRTRIVYGQLPASTLAAARERAPGADGLRGPVAHPVPQ